MPLLRQDYEAQRFRINFSWCVKLRWAAVGGQMVTIGFVLWGLGISLPTWELSAILGAEVLINVGLEFWYRRQEQLGSWQRQARRGDGVFVAIALIDFVFLTALVYLTGGPSNPFTIFYLVNLTLGAVVLRTRWTWLLNVAAVLLYMSLFVDHRPLDALEDRTLVVQGMLVAFTAAASIMIYLLTRVTTQMSRLEAELRQARRSEGQREKLEALATLAAGAAHELATPLSTIAVIARELEVELEKDDSGQHLIEDARLVRREVTRCRAILDLMGAGASQAEDEAVDEVEVARLVDFVLSGMPNPSRVRVVMPDDVRSRTIRLPLSSIAQTLRALLSNAIDASAADEDVRLELDNTEKGLDIHIVDRGEGMDSEVLARATDPFFTTKEPGEGMGLGLYLSKMVVERLGGEFRIASALGEGTHVRVRLPRRDDQRAETEEVS